MKSIFLFEGRLHCNGKIFVVTMKLSWFVWWKSSEEKIVLSSNLIVIQFSSLLLLSITNASIIKISIPLLLASSLSPFHPFSSSQQWAIPTQKWNRYYYRWMLLLVYVHCTFNLVPIHHFLKSVPNSQLLCFFQFQYIAN